MLSIVVMYNQHFLHHVDSTNQPVVVVAAVAAVAGPSGPMGIPAAPLAQGERKPLVQEWSKQSRYQASSVLISVRLNLLA